MCKQKQSRSPDRNAALMSAHPHPWMHTTNTWQSMKIHSVRWTFEPHKLFLRTPTHLGQSTGYWAFIKHLCEKEPHTHFLRHMVHYQFLSSLMSDGLHLTSTLHLVSHVPLEVFPPPWAFDHNDTHFIPKCT